MARIIDIVLTRRDVIAGNTAEAEITGTLAVKALRAGNRNTDGSTTTAWRDYMMHFPGLSAAQLSRLLAEDGTFNDTNLDRKRAYLIANAVCGPNSPNTGMLAFGVNTIDQDVPGAACDAPPADLLL